MKKLNCLVTTLYLLLNRDYLKFNHSPIEFRTQLPEVSFVLQTRIIRCKRGCKGRMRINNWCVSKFRVIVSLSGCGSSRAPALLAAPTSLPCTMLIQADNTANFQTMLPSSTGMASWGCVQGRTLRIKYAWLLVGPHVESITRHTVGNMVPTVETQLPRNCPPSDY